MLVEENRALVRRFVAECVNANRADLIEEFVAKDVRVHPGSPDQDPATEGSDALAPAFEHVHTVFPDLHVTIEDLLGEGDRVVARWTARGTQRAEFLGVPAKGAQATWGGIDVYRLRDGKVEEWWRNDDTPGLLRQLTGSEHAAPAGEGGLADPSATP